MEETSELSMVNCRLSMANAEWEMWNDGMWNDECRHDECRNDERGTMNAGRWVIMDERDWLLARVGKQCNAFWQFALHHNRSSVIPAKAGIHPDGS